MQQQPDLEIEMQIWEYLDGLCSEADHERIARLIANDINWSLKYNELLALNTTIGASIEQDEPGMRFTQNVMDAVAAEAIAPAAKTYLNKWIIRGIAALFIAVVAIVFFHAVGQVEWTTSGNSLVSEVLPGLIDVAVIRFDTIFYGFIFLNIIAGLLLLDGILKSRRRQANEA